jgi:ribonuclease P protein subunit POP4
MRTKENLGRHEWIGLPARVERASDPTLVGVAGQVVDETLRTVTVERTRDGRELVVQKRGTALRLELPSGERTTLELSALELRPQDRVKRAKAARARA